MNLITDKACFGISLRNACLGIAIFFLVTVVFGVIFRPSYLYATTSLLGFIVNIVGNLALLFGVLWSNQWLVLTWLINALIFFISWPFAVLGVIFNYGHYRELAFFNNIFLILVEYIVILAIFLYCTYLVYSYFHQLKSQSSPQHSVVV